MDRLIVCVLIGFLFATLLAEPLLRVALMLSIALALLTATVE